METSLKKSILYQASILILISLIFTMVILKLQFTDFDYRNDTLWSTLDIIGAMMAIATGIVCLIQVKTKNNIKYQSVGIGLLSMGLIRGFAAAYVEDDHSIFLRSVACLIGSFWFFIVLIPEVRKYLEGKKWIAWVSITSCILFCIWTVISPDIIPQMTHKNSFSSITILINLISGTLFLLSSIYYFRDFHKTDNLDSYLIGNMSILIGLARAIFKFSFTWSATWWYLQVLQFAGYAIGAILVFRWYKSMINTLTSASSEFERITEQLIKRNELTKLIIDTAHDGFISINVKGEITEWNIASEQIFGHLRNEVLGKKMSELIIPKKYLEAHNRGFEHYLKTKEGPVLNKRIEITAMRKNGEEFPVEITIRPVQLGNIITFNAFIRDITELKKSIKELGETDARYRLISENTSEIISLYKPDSIFIYVSPSCKKTLGYEPVEMIDHSIYEFCHTEDADQICSINTEILNLKLQSSRTVTYRHKCKNGNYILLETTLKGLHDPRSKTVKQIITISHKIQENTKETGNGGKDNIVSKHPAAQSEVKWPYLRKIDL